MKIIKYFSSFIALVFVAFSLQAQDTNANKILADSKEAFNSLEDFGTDLIFTIDNPAANETVTTSGTVIIAGDNYRFLYESVHVYSNTRYSWHIDMKEEVITKMDFDPDDGVLHDMFYKVYQEDAKPHYDGLEDNLHKITLFWNHDQSEYINAEIWVHESTRIIENVVFLARDGTKLNYNYSNIQTNTGVAASTFEPDLKIKYKGFRVTDYTE